VVDDRDHRFVAGQPVPGPEHATLLTAHDLLLRHADECLPVTLRPSGSLTSIFEPWELTRATFVARMAGTLRHLGYLAPSYSRLDGAALSRTLIEHTITFAWIAGAPAERLPRFIRTSFGKQLDSDRVQRRRGQALLTDDARRQLRAYVSTNGQDMPGLLNRAKQADESWQERAQQQLPAGMRVLDFEQLYWDVFDGYASLDHASTGGLQTFVHRREEPGGTVLTVDGEPERELRRDLGPYWLGTWAFSMALLVSSLHSGRPQSGPLQRTLRVLGALREHEQSGRLDIVLGDDGTMEVRLRQSDSEEG
jgi:hypothetical protein